MKDFLLTHLIYKTKNKKFQIVDHNHGLTPLRKLQILPLFEFVVFIA